MRNALKTAVLLAALGALFMVIGGAPRRHQRAGHRAGHRPRVRRRLLLVQRQARDQGRPAPSPVTREELPQVYAIVEDLTQRAGMPMPKIYVVAGGAAERVRDRPQPRPRRGRASPRASSRCSTATSSAACSPTSCRTCRTATSSSARSRRRWRSASRSSPAWRSGARSSAAADDRDRWQRLRRARYDDPRADRRGAAADGALPLAASTRPTRAAPHLSHDGEPLARALEKIEAYAKQVPMNVDPAQATAYIVNPLTGRKVEFAEPVQHAPADRRAHPAPALRAVLATSTLARCSRGGRGPASCRRRRCRTGDGDARRRTICRWRRAHRPSGIRG